MFKCALVSVTDKTGLKEFLKPYVDQGLKIVSTGGTLSHLKECGFQPIDVSEWTGFPEVMGGRVKTLHPKVHMSLLARTAADSEQLIPEDAALLKQHGLLPFDLVIVNLYPFEQALKSGASGPELIEKIDVGGPTMLRAAAKSFSRTTVVCDPSDYLWLSKVKEFTFEIRKELAAKVFAHTGTYDSMIAQALSSELSAVPNSRNSSGIHSEVGPKYDSLSGRLHSELRYGENPQQKAQWYEQTGEMTGLHKAVLLQGKPLSYNNVLDLDAAIHLLQKISAPACVAVKHNNPCGVAVDNDITLAIRKALAADPVSVFGGIIAINRPLGLPDAEILSTLFLECIIAPKVSDSALALFAKKSNLRILAWPEMTHWQEQPAGRHVYEYKSVLGGFLRQSVETLADFSDRDWNFNGATANPEILESLKLAEKICASLKSNAIAIVCDGQSLGLGMGQVNRVDAVAQAIQRMQAHHGQAKKSGPLVMASDAFFPFKDSVEIAAKAGIQWIVQPGGSIKDEEVLACARERGIQMVMTGRRHFKH